MRVIADSQKWCELKPYEDRADVYALVGINHEIKPYFRTRVSKKDVFPSWRQEFEEAFIIYFTERQLQDLVKKYKIGDGNTVRGSGIIYGFSQKPVQKNAKAFDTSKSLLRMINYGLDYREFPTDF